MKQRTMIAIIGITLIILIVFVYKYSVPPKGERLGPPNKDSSSVVLDTTSHAVTIDK